MPSITHHTNTTKNITNLSQAAVSAQLYAKKSNFTLDVNLQLTGNQVTAIFGPSGCGKTSLLRAIAGLDHCSGSLMINGSIWQNSQQFLPTHKRSVGMVFQEASLFKHLTVQGNLRYAHKRAPTHSNTNSNQTIEQIIDWFDLHALLKRSPHDLSGGERQRVAIARAVAMRPSLLLMDEPLASLDQQRKDDILPYLESLNKQLAIPIIYVTHSLNEVSRLADNLVLMNNGTITASDSVQQLFTRTDLPLAQSPDASSLLTATVAEHDTHYHLTYFNSPAGKITTSKQTYQRGAEVRIQIAARDISIVRQQPASSSILNIFACTIDDIIPHPLDGSALLTLDAQGQKLLARITQKSVDQLELSKSMAVYAQAKSVALLT